MKELFSISNGLDIAKVKSVKSDKTTLKGEKEPSSQSFLSVMFSKMKESVEISKEDTKLNIKLDDNKIKSDIKLDTPSTSEKKSFDEHLLDDILKIVNILKNPNDNKANFPALSKRIEKIINSKQIFEELKKVDNLTDLLKLSKKFDLGLEKISIKKIDFDNLKKEFPKLANKDFFETPKNTDKKPVITETIKQSKPAIIALDDIKTPTKEVKKEPTLLEKIMSSSKKEDNNLNNKKDLHVKVDNDVKEVKKDIHVKVDNDVKEVKKDIHVKIDNEVKEVKKDLHVKIDNEVKNTKEVVQTEAPKVVAKENQEDIKKIVKEDLHVKIDKETKKSDITRINEVKVESNIPKQQSMVKDLLQTKKPEQAKAESKINPQMMASNEEVKTENLTKETHEIKTDNIAQKSDTKLNVRTESTIQKPTFTNQTFSSFADELREKIEQYKPPIMKVQMALNPKGLGEVDVTIVNRGNNLHVNINSNTTTMNIFTQNQAEFKNSLVNMGFTNLEMNFSDQRENKDNQNGKSSNNQANSFEDEILEDENTSLEIVVPRYV